MKAKVFNQLCKFVSPNFLPVCVKVTFCCCFCRPSLS